MRLALGREFEWLWGAFAVSSFGTSLAFGAFPLIAIRVLHAGTGEVAALAAAGLAVGAAVAVPLGPWVEFRRKRPVMVAMDLARFAAMLSIPVAFVLGGLSFAQLLMVSVVSGAADITFRSASGACLKALVRPENLLAANARMESTMWSAIVLGPPLGGAAIGLFGPVATVLADAVSYLLSAAGIRAIGGVEPAPKRQGPERAGQERPGAGRLGAGRLGAGRLRRGDLLDGWRHILAHPGLRPLFFNVIMVNGLIMATEPLLAVLMLGQLRFAPWQYGLAFAVPCTGGLIGSRLARRLVTRFGQRQVMLGAGVLRAVWVLGLAFLRPGLAGLVLVMVVEYGLITCCGIFNPVLATYRLEQTPDHLVTRTLSAWSVSTKAGIAALTGLWGLLASLTSPRAGLAAAGLTLLASPLLLPRRSDPARTSVPNPGGKQSRPPVEAAPRA
jgi:MFS family permease